MLARRSSPAVPFTPPHPSCHMDTHLSLETGSSPGLICRWTRLPPDDLRVLVYLPFKEAKPPCGAMTPTGVSDLLRSPWRGLGRDIADARTSHPRVIAKLL